jgi:hypothetical protein
VLTTVGVPVICPVDPDITSPVGSCGFGEFTEYTRGADPPLAVTGMKGVANTPFTNVVVAITVVAATGLE